MGSVGNKKTLPTLQNTHSLNFMKIISIFNNKSGVGKTTLTYHLAHILAEMDNKVLILDMDSQCNLSLYGMQEKELEKIWRDEEIRS